ncbi:MAG: hypothetical protein IPP40_12715 [bacterium]|nr:hypothetical protein [bacterium]
MKLTLIALLLCVVATMSVRAAELSPTLPDVLSSASETDQIPVIVYLDSKLSMDDVYPQARALPMGPRREYVVRALKERFADMSPNVLKYLEGYEKTGEVSLLRPLWIINAIRVTATPAWFGNWQAVFRKLSILRTTRKTKTRWMILAGESSKLKLRKSGHSMALKARACLLGIRTRVLTLRVARNLQAASGLIPAKT